MSESVSLRTFAPRWSDSVLARNIPTNTKAVA